MASKNVDTISRAHKAFNSRKLDECAGYFADDCVYRDVPRGADFTGRAQFRQFMDGWVSAFSDCKVADPRYIDAGDFVIAEFTARGMNDGQLGTFPATQRRLNMPYCEIVKFDQDGKIEMVTAYYDLLSLLSQLGHLQPPRQMMTQPGATP